VGSGYGHWVADSAMKDACHGRPGIVICLASVTGCGLP
jgi:hypothetical protein